MKTQMRLILSSVVLTALIWTYADRAGHRPLTISVPVTIAPAESDSPLVLRFADADENDPRPNVKSIQMTFRGPNRAIDQLKSIHDYGGFRLTVKIAAEELSPGPQRRYLANDLGDDPDILRRGLTLDSISPDAVDFIVDRYRTEAVKVNPVVGSFEAHLDGKPIIEPPEVNARVLASKLGEGFSLPTIPLPLEERIREEIDAHERQLSLIFTIPLESPPGIDATFDPDEVQVTVKLKALTIVKRITVRPLGVNDKTQGLFREGYEIEWRDPSDAKFTVPINVRVPIENLSEFQPLDPSLIDAYVNIDADDLPQGPAPVTPPTTAASNSGAFGTHEVRFRFPPPFENVQLDQPPPQVRLRIVKKGSADLTTPPPPE